jgi:hypothetical protein
MGQTTETNSLEVRWFGEGAPPAKLDEWVAGFGPVDTSTRTDLYASPPDPSFNLKLRSEDGEFVEAKRRLGSPERRRFGSDAAGDVEQWYKWSFSLDHAPSLWTDEPTGLWQPVRKTRTLAVLDGSDRESFAEPLSDAVTAQVEVTTVDADGLSTPAWTCGLEVAGDADALDAAFDAVASDLFGGSFPVELPADRSLGYAEWLRRRAGEPRAAATVLVPSKR